MVPVLSNRRVFLTGASRGIGFATARLFLQNGAHVIGAARDVDRLQHAAHQLTQLGEFHPLVLDLGERGLAANAAQAVETHFAGRLDILINNAAVMISHQDLEHEPEGTLERSLGINVVAAHHLTRALLPALLQGHEPRIINVSSGAGNFDSVAIGDIASYRVSKFALNGLTMSWAALLTGRVAVNALDPGWVKTDLGGPKAPGTADESAEGALSLATSAWSVTGKFHKDGQEIAW